MSAANLWSKGRDETERAGGGTSASGISKEDRAVHAVTVSLARGRLGAFALAVGLGVAGPLAAQESPAPLNVDPGPRYVPESFAELADRLSPAVVDITTTTTIAQVDDSMRPVLPPGSPFEDFFRDFMDRQPGAPRRPQRSSALGSGFIISPDGYIVTNNHVIESADEISIEFFDGGNLDAELIGRDPRTDIALLKVKSDKDLPFVQFGDSDAAHVGDWVLAIGNPLGQGFSVSAGIVSARNRTLQGSYDDFIQTDAAINRGNSGGPLFNMNGEVIGVNTAILSPNGGSIGIGFAMSSAVVSRVVDQLRDFGETRRGWLGVRIQNIDPDMADALGLDGAKGALVTDVPEGPALAAGIKSGDVILSFGGEQIEDTRELVRIVADTPAGTSVDVVVFRDGKEETLKVDVGLLEEPTLASASSAPDDQTEAPSEETVLGMTVAAVTDDLRRSFALDADARGLVVTSVDESSDAFAKGMRAGDVITEVGQEVVASPKEMRSRIDAAEAAGRNSILLLVRREGQPRFVALNLSN
jgi:serine protease Do